MQPKSSAAVAIRRTATTGLLAALLAALPVRPGAAAETTLALVGGTVIDGTGAPPLADIGNASRIHRVIKGDEVFDPDEIEAYLAQP